MEEKMRRELFGIRRVSPEGFESVTMVARGDDGSFWMEPEYLELRPAEVEALRRRDASKVEREPRTGRLFVEMSALLQHVCPEERRIELYLIASEHLGIVGQSFPGKWDLL